MGYLSEDEALRGTARYTTPAKGISRAPEATTLVGDHSNRMEPNLWPQLPSFTTPETNPDGEVVNMFNSVNDVSCL